MTHHLANDTAIMFSAKIVSSVEKVDDKELSSVANWMENNKLTVNASKTKVMLFGSHHKLQYAHFNISFNQPMLEQVQVFKYLGLFFDPHLKWKAHIAKTAPKIPQRLGILKRIRQYRLCQKKIIQFSILIVEKVNKARQQLHSSG